MVKSLDPSASACSSLVFEGPARPGFFPFWARTATATDYVTHTTSRKSNRSRLFYVGVLTFITLKLHDVPLRKLPANKEGQIITAN